jgi:hypothetical protein
MLFSFLCSLLFSHVPKKQIVFLILNNLLHFLTFLRNLISAPWITAGSVCLFLNPFSVPYKKMTFDITV